MKMEKKYTEHRKLRAGTNDALTWCLEHGDVGKIIILEWDMQKNGSMQNYKAGSDAKVHWKCHICGEEYIKSVRNRIAGRLHEPCGKKIGLEKLRKYHRDRIPYEKSIAYLFPELLEEWDYETNQKLGYDPKCTAAFSSRKVGWICKTCGRKWNACIRTRTKLGCGCKACKTAKRESGKNSKQI